MPFDPELLSELAPAFDDQFVSIANAVPRVVLDLFGADADWVRAVPQRPLQSRRQHDIAVLCGTKTGSASLEILRHIEFQVRAHRQMGLRILVYQAELVREHAVAVESMVVYLTSPLRADEREGVGQLPLVGRAPLTWRWRVRCVCDEPVENFLDAERPTLAFFSSAALAGCEPGALRQALETIQRGWEDSPHYHRILSFHFVLAELRKKGQSWIQAARSLGIDMNDIAQEEEDTFTRWVRERWELAEREGFEAGHVRGLAAGHDEGKAEGRREGKAEGRAETTQRALQLARALMSPDEFAVFSAKLKADDTEVVAKS